STLLEASPSDLEFVEGRVRVRGAPSRELSLGALATAANPIRYAYAKQTSQAALQLVKPREGAVLAEGEEPGLEARGYFAPERALHGLSVSPVHGRAVNRDCQHRDAVAAEPTRC